MLVALFAVHGFVKLPFPMSDLEDVEAGVVALNKTLALLGIEYASLLDRYKGLTESPPPPPPLPLSPPPVPPGAPPLLNYDVVDIEAGVPGSFGTKENSCCHHHIGPCQYFKASWPSYGPATAKGFIIHFRTAGNQYDLTNIYVTPGQTCATDASTAANLGGVQVTVGTSSTPMINTDKWSDEATLSIANGDTIAVGMKHLTGWDYWTRWQITDTSGGYWTTAHLWGSVNSLNYAYYFDKFRVVF